MPLTLWLLGACPHAVPDVLEHHDRGGVQYKVNMIAAPERLGWGMDPQAIVSDLGDTANAVELPGELGGWGTG